MLPWGAEDEGQGCHAPAHAETWKAHQGIVPGQPRPFLATRGTGCETCLCPWSRRSPSSPAWEPGAASCPSTASGYNPCEWLWGRKESLGRPHAGHGGTRAQERSESGWRSMGGRWGRPSPPRGWPPAKVPAVPRPEQKLHREAASRVSLDPALPSAHINS